MDYITFMNNDGPTIEAEFEEEATPPDTPEKELTSEEKTWAMSCHLAAFGGYVVPIPCANIIGPLVVWMIKKDDIPLVDEAGKESMNFQISVMIYMAASFLLCFIAIGFLLIAALIIFQFVNVIIAAVKTGNGESYRYPMNIRFIK